QKRSLARSDGEFADIYEVRHGSTHGPGYGRSDQSASVFFAAGPPLFLMPEFLAQGRPDKSAEQRMGTVRARAILRMELCGQKPGMVFQFDDFDQAAVRGKPAQPQPLCRQLLAVRVVEFEAVPMPLTNFIHPVHLVGERALAEPAEIASEPHRPALVAQTLLVVHQVDDRMGRPVVELGAVRAAQAGDVACEFNRGALHAKAETKERYLPFPCKAD